MSRGQVSLPSQSQQPIEIAWVHREQLHPNEWNPNKMTAFIYAKAHESIAEHGFFDPLLVRPHPEPAMGYQIIDGEHRWMVGSDLGMDMFPVIIRDVDDVTARKLTLIANELHGQADPAKVSFLLKDLLDAGTPEEILRGLPFTEDILRSFLGFDPLPSLPPAPEPPVQPPDGGSGTGRWVERTYRMPTEAAEVLDQAIERAKAEASTGSDVEPWQALEMIAADFLAS